MNKIILIALFIVGCAMPSHAQSFWNGFTITASTETTFSSCTGNLEDNKTGAEYVALGGCSPHWKQLNMNGVPLAQLIGVGLFAGENMTPTQPNSPAGTGAGVFNIIHMMGLDLGEGINLKGHWVTTLNFSDQTLFDQLTK